MAMLRFPGGPWTYSTSLRIPWPLLDFLEDLVQ